MSPITTADALVAALVDSGTDTVFGIPGTHNLPIFAALSRRGVRVIVTRHEQAAAYAADRYARVSLRPGVVVTTTGPGALNAATGMAQAWSDSSPVLLIAPGMPTTKPAGPTGRLHEMPDQFAALSACVDTAVRVQSPAQAGQAVDAFFAAAETSRPRPWYLEVPLDRWDAETGPTDLDLARPASTPQVTDDGLAEAAALLNTAEWPVVIVGGGARGAAADVTELVELLGATVLTSVNGRGVVSEDHPQSLGATLHLDPARSVVADADAVLVVGSELAESDTWTEQLPIGGPIVRIDVDPASVTTNAPTARVMLTGRAEDLVPRLTRALRESVAPDPAAPAPDLSAARRAVRAEADRGAAPWRGLLAGLGAALPDTSIVAADNAKAAYRALQTGLPARFPASYLFPTGFGTLGFALPAALGAALAAPDRPVVAVTGDGGMQFVVGELAGLAAARVPIPVVVVDNGGYGEIRDQMLARGGAAVGVDLTGPDWVALGRSYGLPSTLVAASADDPACADEVADTVTAGLSAAGPSLVVIRERSEA